MNKLQVLAKERKQNSYNEWATITCIGTVTLHNKNFGCNAV